LLRFHFLFFLVISSFNAWPVVQAQTTKKPNVLFIAVDDLRPQLHAYGHAFMVTPNMDKLASQGRLFHHQYVQVPTCGASRYALLTGQWPKQNASLNNGAFALYRSGNAPKSLPQVMGEQGYVTVQMGKISHSPDGMWGDRKPEVVGGWQLLNTPSGQWKNSEAAFFGYEGGKTRTRGKSPPMEAADVPDEGYPDGIMAEAAVEQLKKLSESDKPFFFAVGFYKPHLPFCAPKKYWDLYDRAKIDISDVDPVTRAGGEFFGNYAHDGSQAREDAYVRHLRHGYYAGTSFADAQVGKVLKALDDLKLSDNTIVILWGDHGYHLGELGIWGKHTLYEHSLRSAFIVRTPDMKQPGVATKSMIATIDIYPTIMELTGSPRPDHLDGQSFVSILKDPAATTNRPALSFWGDGESIRTKDHRLIRSGKSVELFDHRTDAGEKKNVAKDQPRVVEMMLKQMDEMLAQRKAK